MDDRTAKTGAIAIACGGLALTGFALASSLDAFAPCRVPYRIPQAVRDSLACHMYAALSVASWPFLIAAVAFAAITVVLLVVRRSAGHSRRTSRND
jgi:hypothetical protein